MFGAVNFLSRKLVTLMRISSTLAVAFWLLLVTLVKADRKAPFSIATTSKSTPFPGLLHFILYPYLIMLSFKEGSVVYVLDMTLNNLMVRFQ